MLANRLGGPAPFIDVLWARERDRHPLDTPEQRTGLERRLAELAGQIEHKSLSREYVDVFRKRLRMLGRTASICAWPAELMWRERTDQVRQRGTRPQRVDPRRPNDEPSFEQDCAAVGAVQRAREGLVIMAIARHPWLLDAHVEEIANLHLDDAGCCRIRNAMLTIHQTEELLDSEKLFEHLSREGYRAELERLERACAHNADSHFASGANKEQVLEGWRHVMMLHGKAGVPRSLREAESDCVSDQTSENYSKLHAIKQQVEIAAS